MKLLQERNTESKQLAKGGLGKCKHGAKNKQHERQKPFQTETGSPVILVLEPETEDA